jgi:hypothetical protein
MPVLAKNISRDLNHLNGGTRFPLQENPSTSNSIVQSTDDDGM